MRSLMLYVVAATIVAPAAAAHPRLLSSNPAANASVAPVSRVQLTFSERLMGQFSRLQVVMTGMPGMHMSAPAMMEGQTALSTDGKILAITFARPLPAGTYRVSYQVVSADTHKVQGSYDFKVR